MHINGIICHLDAALKGSNSLTCHFHFKGQSCLPVDIVWWVPQLKLYGQISLHIHHEVSQSLAL